METEGPGKQEGMALERATWEGKLFAWTPAKVRTGPRTHTGGPYLSKREPLSAAGAVSGGSISAVVSSGLCMCWLLSVLSQTSLSGQR